MKKVLITGNKGYIGVLLCEMLKKNNHYVRGVDINWFTKKKNNIDFVDEQINCGIDKLEDKHFEDIDCIVHLAAISNDPMSEEFKTETYDINLNQSKKLYNQAKKNNVKKFIFASSCSLYGFAIKDLKSEKSTCKPLTNYSKTKFLFEKFLNKKKDKIKKIILRFGTAAGVSRNFRLDLAINNLIYNGIKNKKIKVISNGKPFRPFIDTEDMCRSIIYFLESKLINRNNTYNVGINKNNIQVLELAKIISKKLQIPYEVNTLAADDKRSYKVNFNKIKKQSSKLIKKFKSIERIVDELIIFMKSKKFKPGKANYRLNYLKDNYLKKDKKLI